MGSALKNRIEPQDKSLPLKCIGLVVQKHESRCLSKTVINKLGDVPLHLTQSIGIVTHLIHQIQMIDAIWNDVFSICCQYRK